MSERVGERRRVNERDGENSKERVDRAGERGRGNNAICTIIAQSCTLKHIYKAIVITYLDSLFLVIVVICRPSGSSV